ncbi:venom acid phosphatase Acph-1 [Dendroctonus ponderosae]|uniref:acid phosphatase n=1 Tax=Dendroctonus ponderosae TaxID=77166 RepID=U4U1S0_DENPD|nr:venom acid phosphatase Acph-1 [Dendroctonus ponderosae]ERL84546.1 hypothetical protein D910_01976 [Dendroctonus ponderosae]KAH1029805.1 hypothetical protein HUJ05_002969 [Dendroctonus ponderosae]
MKSFTFLIVFPALWASLSASALLPSSADSSTLKLLHVMFRHGNRNPDEDSIIPNSTYSDESYYPEGFGQLTNAGKLTEYTIGLLLRARYNKFFTDTWNVNYLEARSTNVNRTKMSLELLLAGLYPPKKSQVWSDLPWQPIPFNYVPTAEDKETLPWAACATNLNKLLSEITGSPEIVAYGERYSELLEILTEKSGSTATLLSPYSYYFGFATQEELGYTLDSWVSSIYPEPIHSAAVDYYYYYTNNTAIRKLAAGYLLKKILADTKSKIDGTISPSSRKAFLYSAHELNSASMLLSLNAFKITEVPPYGAHVIFEVHEILGIWGIKLFYQNYQSYDPIPVKINGCGYFCPYEEFYSLVEEILPESDDECFS